MTQPRTITDLKPYQRKTNAEHAGVYAWRFPNGLEPSLIPDPMRPARFEIHMPGLRPATGDIATDLTSKQAETKLLAIFNQPRA